LFGEDKIWRIIEFGMLDEIIEKYMNTPIGKWADFERDL